RCWINGKAGERNSIFQTRRQPRCLAHCLKCASIPMTQFLRRARCFGARALAKGRRQTLDAAPHETFARSPRGRGLLHAPPRAVVRALAEDADHPRMMPRAGP